MRFSSLMLLVALVGCGETGQRVISYDAVSVGDAAPFVVGNWTITLTNAKLGLGPLYFCATASASADLCPAAVNELADVVTIDLLSSTPTHFGTIRGTTGSIRSVTFDYGITWFTTQIAATPFPTAPDGHSLVLAGHAEAGGAQPQAYDFAGTVDIAPQFAGSLVMQGYAAVETVTTDQLQLVATLRPADILREVDFDALAAHPVIAPGDDAHNAITTALTTVGGPVFSWVSLAGAK